jgi:putative ABC transport system permease protein
MRALDRKLLRDLFQMKAQLLAAALVMASGVAMLVLSLGTIRALERAQQSFYREGHFADVFAHLKRAPNFLMEQIREIPGVLSAESRVVAEAILDVEGLSAVASARLISIPDHEEPLLNRLTLQVGRYPSPATVDEVLAGAAFAEANSLNPGDSVTAIINGRQQNLRIVGIALSPEFIYQIREGEFFPDDRRFGIFWMHERPLSIAYGMEGAFNNVVIGLAPYASEQAVIERLDLLLERYGGSGAFGRRNQISHEYVTAELQQLRTLTSVIPLIFLGVAAFLLNIVMHRLLRIQREQIGALKAFGYSDTQVGVHYLKMILVVILTGAVAGSVAGARLGEGLTALYVRFFRFPVFEYRLEWDVILLTLAVCGGAILVGSAGAIWQAVRLPPATAMRTAPPASYRPTFIERHGLQRFLSHTARIVFRELERRPIKSTFSCLGLSLATAILLVGSLNQDLIDALIEREFFQRQRYDVIVTFNEITAGRALSELSHFPGVLHAEPFRSAGVEISSGHRQRRVGLTGLPSERELLRLLDREAREVDLPAQGLVISRKLAELLHVSPGDALHLRLLEGRRPEHTVTLAGTIDDYSGLAAYMEIYSFRRLMREESTLSGAFLLVDPAQIAEFHQQVKLTPGIRSASEKEAAFHGFMETFAENLLRMRMFNIGFATIIAFGVVYNNARIALSERSRELATLRVLGFTRGEVSFILLGELGVLTAVAVPLGLLLGYGMAALLVVGLQTETLRLPLAISPATFSYAATVTLVAVAVSSLSIRRRLDQLNLVDVLKAPE